MKYFLLVYDRKSARLVSEKVFSSGDRSVALEERFRHEREYQARPEIEVVLLGAESREDLERTHSRYFRTLEQIASST